MKKGFSNLDNPNHEGKTNTWLTPLWIIKALGEFDLDPCAFPGHITAKTRWHGPPLKCGLENDWFGRVWLNPPYGRNIGKWLKKMDQHKNGIALVFARTDTKWFHDVKPDFRFFLKGRIKFLNSNFEESTNAGHGSVLLVWGKDNLQAIFNSKLNGLLLK